jgi:LPXTG-motif cell wall-anchored protein
VKDGTVTITSSTGKVVTVPTDASGRYESACLESGTYTVTVSKGVATGGTPTNGPKERSVTIGAGGVSIDFGFAGAFVKSENIGQPEAGADLAYTGSEMTALLALALGMIGLGLSLLRQRRHFLTKTPR